MNEFEVHLFSTGSINIFLENALSHFTNQLPEVLYLEGEWAVALSEISYPTAIKNITGGRFLQITKYRDISGQVSHSYKSARAIKPGVYEKIDDLLDAIKEESLGSWRATTDDVTRQLEFEMDDEDETLRFYSREIPNILGFDSPNLEKYGYLEINGDRGIVKGDYPVDIMAGRHFMFVYMNGIEYQFVGDTKAPMLRVITLNSRMKNGCINHTQPIQHETFQDLQFRKVLSNNFSSLNIELRNENGEYVPFLGNGAVTITLKFKKIK